MTKFRHNPNKIRESKLDISLNVVNIVLMLLGVILILFPMFSYFSLAFSDGAYNVQVVLFPKGWTLKPFKIHIFRL